MKIFYFTFKYNGEVTVETLKARKNKEDFAVDAYTTYGGKLHERIGRFMFKDEGKILNYWNNYDCYMYSTTVDKVSQEMIDFNKKRLEKVKQIEELEHSIENMAKNFRIESEKQ